MELKPVIVCIVGPSGTGKSYLADYLLEKYNVPLIESRTTRPRRHPEETGHTFVSNKEFDSYKKEDMLAFTTFGDYRYCCLIEDVVDPVMSYVLDEFGLIYLREHFSHQMTIFALRMFAREEEIAKRVDAARRQRDKGLFTLSDDAFDYFIENDYTDSMYEKYDRLYERIKQL